MENPTVTIAVCTRNRPKELAACLKSLIEQETHVDFEIVCVENDAEEKSRTIVEEWIPVAEAKGISLRYFCQPKKNIGLTRNVCIANSRAESFIAFIDDDEWATSDWLDELICVQKKLEPMW